MAESTVETDSTSPPDVQLNLRDLLKTYLPRFPIPRHKRIACQTTARPAKKFLYKRGKTEKLVGLIYYPSLLDESLQLAGELAEKIPVNKANFLDVVFMTYISPELTSSFCSPELFSENDSREYCGAALIRPALAAMYLVKKGGIPKTFKCTDSSTDAYVTSGFKKKDSPIADNLLIRGPYEKVKVNASVGSDMTQKGRIQGGEDKDESQLEDVVLVDEADEDETNEEERDEVSMDEEEQNRDDSLLLGTIPEVLMTMETKTSTALTGRTFSDVLRFKELDRFKDAGYVMRFIWPEVKGQKIKKLSKNVAQVYEQMYHSDKAEYAWLSSYDVNIFFYMKRGSHVMYMSDQYDRETMTPLHVFAWFCRANGLLEGDLKVPTRDDTFLNVRSSKSPNHVGLQTEYMYDTLSEELPEPPATPEAAHTNHDTDLPSTRTYKRGRDDASEDVHSDNETTPKQRDFRFMKRRK